MRCDEALEAISAAIDGELIDDDGTVRGELDEHIAGCEECRDFQSYTVELRARLRFEAVDTSPDVAPAVVALLERVAAERATDAESEGDERPGRSGRDEGATVTTLPFWRRARTALRPAGRAGTGPGGGAGARGAPGGDPDRRGRPLAAAVAAATLAGVIVGAAFVGVGQDTTPTAWAEDLPEQVIEAQRDITSVDADIVVTERGRPDHTGERRFTGHLSYEAPERLALELSEEVAGVDEDDEDDGVDGVDGVDGSTVDPSPTAGAGAGASTAPAQLQPGEGDVHLLVRDDRWWLETVRSCTAIAGETSCPPGGARWVEEVMGREAFSDAAPIPLELIGPVDSFTLAAAPPVLGERRIAGREAVGVRVPAAQVGHFLAALSPGGDLRAVHPGDPVDVWLDRDDLVPLAVDVAAGESDERAAWAAANGFRDEAGDTVLSFSVVAISVNEAVPDAVFEWPEVESPADGADEAAGDATGPEASDPTGDPEPGAGAGNAGDGGEGLPGDAGLGGEGGDPTLPDGAATDPSGGAGLPTSTTTTTPPDAPIVGTQPPGDVRVGANPYGTQPSTTALSPAPTTSVPGDPGDPPTPTSTTTMATTTTLPPTTTTTTLPTGEDDVDDPVDEGQGEEPADGDETATDDETGAIEVLPDNRTTRDEGFRPGEADLVPEPAQLPDGMEPYVSGTVRTGDGPLIGVRTWTDGRAWVKVRATSGWDVPRLFGELGDAVRQVDLGDAGQGYVSADGRKVALHTDGLDVVASGSLPTEQLRDIAATLDLVGETVPSDWPEAASATLEEARAAEPGLLVPRALQGFGPPAVDVEGGSVTLIYAGPGDRAFTLTRSDTPELAPAPGEGGFGVEVRTVDGRYSVPRGELEWSEGGASYSLRSTTVTLRELLTIADTLAPSPAVP